MAGDRAAYAMIYTIHELVSTKAFLVGIIARGKAVMVREEDGKWWFYGVEPGAIAESGDSPQEAYIKFVGAFKAVLSDYASTAPGFSGFEKEVKTFFYQKDDADCSNWKSAAEALRKGNVKPEAPFSVLPQQPAETPAFISFERLDAGTIGFEYTSRHETHLAIPHAA